mmetsp:Transcript_13392/g.35997  ORF Transcript_13392/g.35997 Transcript_13392/m.35997 type:complete len:330 (-) Transcript_13392:1437-2426(-)
MGVGSAVAVMSKACFCGTSALPGADRRERAISERRNSAALHVALSTACRALKVGATRTTPTMWLTRRARLSPSIANGLRMAASHAEDPIKLMGKTVVVTGTNRGIGLEFVKQLAEKGNKVIATVRSEARATALKELRNGFPEFIQITELDVADARAIALWASLLGKTGVQVDVLINNAGVVGTDGYNKWTIEDTDPEEMMYCFSANAIGPVVVVQQLLKRNIFGRGALIANVSSKVGSVSDNQSGRGYAYRASKAALNVVTKSLHVDLTPRGMTCTLLHPGWVITDMTEQNGLITTAESVAGMLGVLESKSRSQLGGQWHDYAAKPIPW